jgi:hypothetical protein
MGFVSDLWAYALDIHAVNINKQLTQAACDSSNESAKEFTAGSQNKFHVHHLALSQLTSLLP